MLDRSVVPQVHEINEISISQVVEKRLSNNVPVYYLNAGLQPVCKLELIVYCGKWHELKAGASSLAFRMLQEGTQKLSSFDISEKIDQTGSYLSSESGMKFSALEVYFLKDKAEIMIPLLSELTFDSTFPEKELENRKQILSQSIKIELEKTSAVATRLFREKLFGTSHPYGAYADPESVQSITLSDVTAFYQDKILQSKMELIASGSIDDNILELLNDNFGKHKIAHGSESIDYTPETQYEKSFVDKEDSSQTSIRIGKFCLKKTDPDYHKLYITNEILGGYFGSRLMQNIREKKGLTYGIYSQLAATKDLGYFMIGADARKELRDTVIDEVFKEIQLLQNQGVSLEELTTVRNYLLGEFLGEVNTPFNLAGKFKAIHLHDLDYTFYDEYFKTLKAIQPEDVQQMAQKYFQVKDIIVVGVG